jgi:hypothetical protein
MNDVKLNREPSIDELIEQLGDASVSQRRRAREALVARGPAALPALTGALNDTRRDIRWEAARTLAAEPFPWAASALVRALEDEDMDVRWVVAEALIEQGREGARVILERLAGGGHDIWLYQGAHHALDALAEGELREILFPVVEALAPRFDGRDEQVPVRALHALTQLTEES